MDGDATGRGHGPRRQISGKSEFPATLSDNEIILGIEAIANDPTSYPGGMIPLGVGRFKISGDVKGIRTTVIVDPGAAEVITAWLAGIPRNP